MSTCPNAPQRKCTHYTRRNITPIPLRLDGIAPIQAPGAPKKLHSHIPRLVKRVVPGAPKKLHPTMKRSVGVAPVPLHL